MLGGKKTTLTKRSFLFLLSALFVGGLMVAQAGAVEWRMAHKMPPDSPEGKVFQKFADLTAKHSGGELTIKMFRFFDVSSGFRTRFRPPWCATAAEPPEALNLTGNCVRMTNPM